MAVGLAFDSESGSLAGRLEEICEGFESAWRRNELCPIDDVLRSAGELRDKALVELVHIELELRLQAGEAARAEEYFARFPELAADQAAALALIKAEFRHRLSLEPDLAPSEFVERFRWLTPDLELRTDLTPLRSGLTAAGPKCPYCRELLKLDADLLGEELFCSCCGSSFRLERNDAIGSARRLPKIGKFELLNVVGQGACGTVYRAKDVDLDRIVAVKLPRSGALGSQQDEDRFLREGRSVAQLRHSGIVPVYEVGRAGVFPYMASEFVEGRTLANAIAGRRFGFRDAAEIVAQAAEALHHAHSQGIVHRDIKPSNIMIVAKKQTDADGRTRRPLVRPPVPRFTVRVMDFGLARRDEGEATITVSGQLLGTPAYMSPEQARGESHRVTGQSDIYSLGAILYQLLTHELPFRGNRTMLVYQVLHEDPRPPRQLNDRIPKDLETITLKCLQKPIADRYSSAEELALDLRRFLKDEPVSAKSISRATQALRWVRRHPLSVVVGATVALLLMISVVCSVGFIREARVAAAERLLREQLEGRVQQTTDVEDNALHAEDHSFVVALLIRGVELTNRGQVTRALADFDAAVALEPKNPEVYTHRAHARLAAKDLDGAYNDYTSVMSLDGIRADKHDGIHLATAYHKRGLGSIAHGDWSNALADFNRAIALDAENLEYYASRAHARLALENLDGAYADYIATRFGRKQADDNKLELVAAYHKRGLASIAKCNWNDAVDSFNRAIELDPDYADAHLNCGLAKKALGELRTAIAEYTNAIRTDPQNAEAYICRAEAEFAVGNSLAALNDLDQVVNLLHSESHDAGTRTEIQVKIEPDYEGQAQNKASLGDFDGAMDDISKALDTNHKNPLVLDDIQVVRRLLAAQHCLMTVVEALPRGRRAELESLATHQLKLALEGIQTLTKSSVSFYPPESTRLETENLAIQQLRMSILLIHLGNRGTVLRMAGDSDTPIEKLNREAKKAPDTSSDFDYLGSHVIHASETSTVDNLWTQTAGYRPGIIIDCTSRRSEELVEAPNEAVRKAREALGLPALAHVKACPRLMPELKDDNWRIDTWHDPDSDGVVEANERASSNGVILTSTKTSTQTSEVRGEFTEKHATEAGSSTSLIEFGSSKAPFKDVAPGEHVD